MAFSLQAASLVILDYVENPCQTSVHLPPRQRMRNSNTQKGKDQVDAVNKVEQQLMKAPRNNSAASSEDKGGLSKSQYSRHRFSDDEECSYGFLLAHSPHKPCGQRVEI
ncbi:hypothetical protein GBA52_028790 [Prunus armeniaca]|nr:hypothetical protein GBA52_028790 [Prunus armeniaca]